MLEKKWYLVRCVGPLGPSSINGPGPKTAAECERGSHVADAPTGPDEKEEAIVAVFRRHTMLPPDDRLYFIL